MRLRRLHRTMMQPEATMEDFTEELKEEILLRMPIKSLLRLKCVSKSWRSRISNPNFAKLHLQRSNYSQHPNRILLTSCPHLSSIDINTSLHDDSDTINLNFPPFKPHDKVRTFCSCRGFVLLFVNEDLFIWNPVTGSYKQISLPPRCKYPPSPFAFCYDESIDDYFIGLSYPFYDLHIHAPKWRFEILSLRTNSWEKLDLNRSPFLSLGTIFNGAIHFIVHTRGLPEVIAFDMTTKDLRKVPSPIGRNLCVAELGVHEGGCLALTAETTEEIQVWMMREYGVESSWTKFISVASDHQSGIYNIFIPSLVIYKERDEEFVTTYVGIDFSGEGLAKLNYKGQLVEHIRTYGPDHLCKRPASQFKSPSNAPRTYLRRPVAYTETLLPLPS